MLGVKPLVERTVELLLSRKISTEAARADGYSLFPVHAWSHNVSDVVTAVKLLEATGDFKALTPTKLLEAIAANVAPDRPGRSN
eukprot:SAG11_NODE_7110_length_1192_cov_1.130833_1_plen_84_part_00